MKIGDFIVQHANDDIRNLALQASRWPEIDMSYALEQISGRQKAKHKLPTWAETEGVVYPPRLSMEQCSSEQTARYKAAIARRLLKDSANTSMADLTGGFGVDFSFLSREFSKATYVERNPQLCAISSKNFELLALQNITIVCGNAEDQIESIGHTDLIFLDPARRDLHGGKTVAIADCTPNVSVLWPQLLSKACFVMLKLSPMLDIEKAVRDLGGNIAEVHIVAVQGECKELLLVGSVKHKSSPAVHCVNLKNNDEMDCFSYHVQEKIPVDLFNGDLLASTDLLLCEPDATIMKAGCFGELCNQFSVEAIAPNSHLFLANKPPKNFPGRCFKILHTSTMNHRELKAALASMDRANVAVRNFPLSAEALRTKLKLKDGGQTYLFATTDREKRHVLLITEKL